MSKLIFIYNAESGWRNAILDSAHKLINPSTYTCSLCALTYHTFGEKSTLKKFRINSSIPMEFLHRDEPMANENSLANISLPAVIYKTQESVEIIINTNQLNCMKSLDELVTTIKLWIQTNLNT